MSAHQQATSAADGVDATVVLYTRPGCHLCGPARSLVAEVCARWQVDWIERDISADAELGRRYGELIPVVEVAGICRGYWRIDADRIEAAIAAVSQTL